MKVQLNGWRRIALVTSVLWIGWLVNNEQSCKELAITIWENYIHWNYILLLLAGGPIWLWMIAEIFVSAGEFGRWALSVCLASNAICLHGMSSISVHRGYDEKRLFTTDTWVSMFFVGPYWLWLLAAVAISVTGGAKDSKGIVEAIALFLLLAWLSFQWCFNAETFFHSGQFLSITLLSVLVYFVLKEIVQWIVRGFQKPW
jgi:hypothetical protein